MVRNFDKKKEYIYIVRFKENELRSILGVYDKSPYDLVKRVLPSCGFLGLG